MHPRNAAVAEALSAGGIDAEIVFLDDHASTAVAAAAQLGVDVGAIANSLVFDADGETILVMTSGAHRVDTSHLAEQLGVTSIDRATPAQVKSASGQVIGGVAPVGHPSPIRTYVDSHLADYPQLWAAAGTADSVFPLSYDQLLDITNGKVVTVEP